MSPKVNVVILTSLKLTSLIGDQLTLPYNTARMNDAPGCNLTLRPQY